MDGGNGSKFADIAVPVAAGIGSAYSRPFARGVYAAGDASDTVGMMRAASTERAGNEELSSAISAYYGGMTPDDAATRQQHMGLSAAENRAPVYGEPNEESIAGVIKAMMKTNPRGASSLFASDYARNSKQAVDALEARNAYRDKVAFEKLQFTNKQNTPIVMKNKEQIGLWDPATNTFPIAHTNVQGIAEDKAAGEQSRQTSVVKHKQKIAEEELRLSAGRVLGEKDRFVAYDPQTGEGRELMGQAVVGGGAAGGTETFDSVINDIQDLEKTLTEIQKREERPLGSLMNNPTVKVLLQERKRLIDLANELQEAAGAPQQAPPPPAQEAPQQTPQSEDFDFHIDPETGLLVSE